MLYPLDIVPEPLRDLLALNPLAPLFELARKWVIDPTRRARSAADGLAALLAPGRDLRRRLCVLAVWVFKREAPRIAEEL